MKYLISILIVIVIPIIIIAQDTSNTFVPGVVKQEVFNAMEISSPYTLDESICNFAPVSQLSIKEVVIMLGLVRCETENKDYYKVLSDQRCLLVDTSYIITDKRKLQKLISIDTSSYNSYVDRAIKLQKYIILKDTLDAISDFKSKCKIGLVILERQVYDESDYTDGTGFKVRIHNGGKKTIKYITFYYAGYNSVNDPVSSFGKSILKLKGIGPILPNEAATYIKEYAWFTDIVEYSKIKSIEVQYMDNTLRVYKNIDQITLSERTKKLLEIDD